MSNAFTVLKTLAARRLVFTFDKIEFVHENLSWKRLANWLLAELSYVVNTRRPWAYPTHLQIEPSSMCNLRCPACLSVNSDRPKGLLTLEDFQKLIDEAGEYLLFLHFWGWGEPFLNENIYSMIKLAKKKGIKIISSTNGHFFADESNIERLIDSGLDVLIFALDGVDRETYEKYRRMGDFDRVLSNLRLLVRRKAEVGATVPRINLRMLVTKDNEDQVSAMKQLAQETGVDVLTLKTYYDFRKGPTETRPVPRNPEFHRFEYDLHGHPIRKANPCKKPWNHPTVYRDGTVVLCDYHTGTDFSLGNAFAPKSGGFRSVWFGKDFEHLRARFGKGDRAGLLCDTCSLNFADVDRCVSHAFAFGSRTTLAATHESAY